LVLRWTWYVLRIGYERRGDKCAKPNELLNDVAFPFGPGFPLILLQALGAGPVSAAIPNAECAPGNSPDIASLVDPLFRKRERGFC
jgi:hypothetical protein